MFDYNLKKKSQVESNLNFLFVENKKFYRFIICQKCEYMIRKLYKK